MSVFSRFKKWRADRKRVRNSEIQIYASRKTTFPLEHCTADNLRTAAAFNERKAAMYAKRTSSVRHMASAAWNELAARSLRELAHTLKPGQVVGELPVRKRREAVNTLLRIEQGKAK
jgi:hypothetical protein